jgi:hypothetical protein
MSEEWKKPLSENLHHLTTAFLFLSMLFYDFVPLVAMIGLMRVSEWLVHEKNYSFLKVPLETLMNNIEVFLLLAFMIFGAIKILFRLALSINEMRKPASEER